MNIELALALSTANAEFVAPSLSTSITVREVIPHDANGRAEGHFMACVIFVYFNMLCVPTPTTWRK